MIDLALPAFLTDPSVRFHDAKGCRDWLAEQPLANPAAVHTHLNEVLDKLNLTQIPAIARLTILEMLREPAARAHEGVIDSFAGKPLPLGKAETGRFHSA